jgi:hypothetical protein
MMVARLPKMKKSYHSIIVPAVDAAMTRQMPAGGVFDSSGFVTALILGMHAVHDNHQP